MCRMKRLIGVMVLVLSSRGGAGGSSSAGTAPSPIPSSAPIVNVSYSQATVSQGALFSGVDQGFFAANGLDVPIRFRGGFRDAGSASR